MNTIIIYHYMILTIDVAILAILVQSFIKHYVGRGTDVNFHSRMLLLCTCLLIANTFAFITSLYGYFIIHSSTSEVINMGRFADRYTMMFGYIALNKINERY